MTLQQTTFLTSAASQSGWPQDQIPEIVFLGRSNVGKSTVLNRLTNQKQLARVSVQPGRTRLLNFFSVSPWNFRLVDAPGYGYAALSIVQSKAFELLMVDYLSKRSNLVAGVMLLDARRVPNQDEKWVIHHLQKRKIPIIFVATKWDKLNQSEKVLFERKYVETLQHPFSEVICAAPNQQEWVKQLEDRILATLPQPTVK